MTDRSLFSTSATVRLVPEAPFTNWQLRCSWVQDKLITFWGQSHSSRTTYWSVDRAGELTIQAKGCRYQKKSLRTTVLEC